MTLDKQSAGSLLGAQVRYTAPDGSVIEGRCMGMRRSGTIIRDMETGQEWPGIKFRVRTKDGRDIETVTYPDKSP